MKTAAVHHSVNEIGKLVPNSKLRFSWVFDIEGRRHSVEVKVSKLRDKICISSDDFVLLECRNFTQRHFEFEVEPGVAGRLSRLDDYFFWYLFINDVEFKKLYSPGSVIPSRSRLSQNPSPAGYKIFPSAQSSNHKSSAQILYENQMNPPQQAPNPMQKSPRVSHQGYQTPYQSPQVPHQGYQIPHQSPQVPHPLPQSLQAPYSSPQVQYQPPQPQFAVSQVFPDPAAFRVPPDAIQNQYIQPNSQQFFSNLNVSPQNPNGSSENFFADIFPPTARVANPEPPSGFFPSSHSSNHTLLQTGFHLPPPGSYSPSHISNYPMENSAVLTRTVQPTESMIARLLD